MSRFTGIVRAVPEAGAVEPGETPLETETPGAVAAALRMIPPPHPARQWSSGCHRCRIRGATMPTRRSQPGVADPEAAAGGGPAQGLICRRQIVACQPVGHWISLGPLSQHQGIRRDRGLGKRGASHLCGIGLRWSLRRSVWARRRAPDHPRHRFNALFHHPVQTCQRTVDQAPAEPLSTVDRTRAAIALSLIHI